MRRQRKKNPSSTICEANTGVRVLFKGQPSRYRNGEAVRKADE